eukprot:PITA_27517
MSAFEGNKKLLPLPLKPIEVEVPLQQWGLDFIGEIHPSSSAQHKWILATTDYFTKWIEVVPTRQAIDYVIMQFLEDHILSRNSSTKIIARRRAKPNDAQIRINQLIHLQHTVEEVYNNTHVIQDKIKRIHDRRVKAGDFQLNDIVLKWDSINEEKGKHGKFDSLWKGPYRIAFVRGTHAFLLEDLTGETLPRGPINGRLLKHYFT